MIDLYDLADEQIEQWVTDCRDVVYALGFVRDLSVDDLVVLIADSIECPPMTHTDRRAAFTNGMFRIEGAPLPIAITLRRGAA